MSSPPVRPQAVAVKGLRKRERSSSGESSQKPFRGCRDSTSPIRGGTMQRAVESRKLHHRVVLETPPMHRHFLEGYLENLWEETGIESNFIRSSLDQDDMDFYRGSSPQRDETGDINSVPTTRQVVSVPVPGYSITGDMDYRVTASSSGTGPAGPTVSPKRQR